MKDDTEGDEYPLIPLGTVAVWRHQDGTTWMVAWKTKYQYEGWNCAAVPVGSLMKAAFSDNAVWDDIKKGTCELSYVPHPISQ